MVIRDCPFGAITSYPTSGPRLSLYIYEGACNVSFAGLRFSNVLSLLIEKTIIATVVCVSLAGQWAIAQNLGSIQGTVTDSSGTPILGAVVAVEGAAGNRGMTVTDVVGAFKVTSLAIDSYNIRISAAGLSDWTAENVRASVNPESNPVTAVLQVAPAVTAITVGLSEREVAAAQL